MRKTINYIILIITIILLTINPMDGFAKGLSGSYTLSGVAMTKRGDTLRNERLLMSFNDKTDTLFTDWNGHYQVIIPYGTACPSNVKRYQLSRLTRKMNPKYISFSFNKNSVKVKNEWRRFLHANSSNPEDNVKKTNLIFPLIASSQNENIFVKLPNTYFIYAGYDNILKVSFNKKSVKNLSLECDNCDTIKPYYIYENEWIIRGVKLGELNIKVNNKKGEEVAQETFYVLPPPEPVVSLNDNSAASLIVKTPTQIALKMPPSIPLRVTFMTLKWEAKIDGKTFSGTGKYLNKDFIDYVTTKKSGTIRFKINYNDPFRENEVIEIFQYSFE